MSYQECFLHIFGEKTIIFSQKSGLGFFQKTFGQVENNKECGQNYD